MLLAIFAKYWEPGAVKTRLAEAVGAEAAAEFHRVCVKTLAMRLASVEAERILVHSPDEQGPAFAQFVTKGWQLLPQGAGDLGARLKRFFNWAFACGAMRAAVMGADSPTLPIEYVRLAFERLSEFPVVLGPAEDGGYYLVAARPPTPPIFDEIDWGSPHVWQQTMARLEAAKIPCGILPLWYDVDAPRDLVRLAEELARLEPPHCRELAMLVARLVGLLSRDSTTSR